MKDVTSKLRREEFVSLMVRCRNDAASRGVTSKLRREEFASRMVQQRNHQRSLSYAASRGVPSKL